MKKTKINKVKILENKLKHLKKTLSSHVVAENKMHSKLDKTIRGKS